MSSVIKSALEVAPEYLAEKVFKASEGMWRSERRYFTLHDGSVQEVVSQITVRFLLPDAPELIALAEKHELPDGVLFACGAESTWESNYIGMGRKQSSGSTVFGVKDGLLYRDRGFATSRPVTANYHCRDEKVMVLKTEYNGSAFEEEIKLIGQNYRTRQTIISRAGEEQMIGQYLEKRIL